MMLTRRSTFAALAAALPVGAAPAAAAAPAPFVAVGHHAFYADELLDGRLPIYDMAPDTPAGGRLLAPGHVVSAAPTRVIRTFKAKRMLVPLFAKPAEPEGLDRLIFQMITCAAASNPHNPPLLRGARTRHPAPAVISRLAEGVARVNRWGLLADTVFVSGDDAPRFAHAALDPWIDRPTPAECAATAQIGTLWGARLYHSPFVVRGTAYVLAEPECFGVMPTRGKHCVGLGIHNPRALQAVSL